MKDLGKTGEQFALNYLLQKGYVFLHKNWRAGHKEIDLIVENNDFLVFIEVKTRSNNRFGQPEEAVNPKKQKKLLAAARVYCRKMKIKKEIRFDIVAITFVKPDTKINHIENALFPQYYI